MSWVFFAFLTAFSLSTADALTKRALASTDDFVVTWVREAYALPFLLVVFLFVPLPSLDGTFWTTVFLLLPLEITALILYVKAIKLSPLSLTIPFMAFSPVFIILIAFIILGELPDRTGFVGILLIALGAYLLNAGALKEGVLAPLKAIWRERGSLFMLIVAFIYSITSTLGKVAVQHSDPVFFGVFYPFVLTISLTPFILLNNRVRYIFSRPMSFSLIGFFTALMIVSHFVAISLTDVAYMISIKRTSLIFSVLYGKFLFGEERIKERLLGSTVMVGGVILITVF